MTGHWFTNGRYLMSAGVSGAFSWNGSATTNALYATVVNSAEYTPDMFNDTTLQDAVGVFSGSQCPNEPSPTVVGSAPIRFPVPMAAIQQVHVDSPSSDYIIYPAVLGSALAWIVSSGTLLGGLVLFYWDKNGNVSNGSPAAYYPTGPSGNSPHDDTSLLLASAPLIDSLTNAIRWTAPATIAYPFDLSFTGYTTVLRAQVK